MERSPDQTPVQQVPADGRAADRSLGRQRPPQTPLPGHHPKPTTTTHPRRGDQPAQAHQPRTAPHQHRMGHQPDLKPGDPQQRTSKHWRTPATTPRNRCAHRSALRDQAGWPNTNTQQPPRTYASSTAVPAIRSKYGAWWTITRFPGIKVDMTVRVLVGLVTSRNVIRGARAGRVVGS